MRASRAGAGAQAARIQLAPGELLSRRELEALAAAEPGTLLRRGPGRETFRCPGPGGRERIVKRYRGGPLLEGLLEGLRERLGGAPARSPARREHEALAALAAAGLAVPRPLGLLERGDLSLVVLEDVPHAENLRQRLERRPQEARRWLGPLLELVLGLHGAGWYHRDLYLDHFLVAERAVAGGAGAEQLVLIDLGRARRDARPRGRWFVKDLAALHHSTPPGVEAGLALRFLLGWARARGVEGRAARRRLRERVLAKAARMAAHRPRGGTSFPSTPGEELAP